MCVVQELQTACRGTASTAAAVGQLQQEVQDLAQSQQQLRAHTDACQSSASSSSRQLQEVAQHLQQLDERVAGQTSDLTGLAEAVLGCLGAARQHAAAAAAAATQPPSSYLSNLLGPAVPPPPPVAPAASKQQWGAWVSEAWLLSQTAQLGWGPQPVKCCCWPGSRRFLLRFCKCVSISLAVTVFVPQDEQLTQVDGLVARLRRQQRAAEFSGSAAHALLGSPAR